MTNDEIHSKTLGSGGITGVANGDDESEVVFEHSTTTNGSVTAKDMVGNGHVDDDEGLTAKNDEEGETSSEEQQRSSSSSRRVVLDVETDDDDEDSNKDDNDVERNKKQRQSTKVIHGLHSSAAAVSSKAAEASKETFWTVWNGFWNKWTWFWAKNPRCHAVIFRIVIPMSILLGSAALGGWGLSRLEVDAEYSANDEIMAARRIVETLDINSSATSLVDLPIFCLDEYFNRTLRDEEFLPQLIEADVDLAVPESISNFAGDLDIGPEYLWNLRVQMVNCSSRSEVLLDIVRRLSNTNEIALATQDLSFNWGRCWNTSQYGPYLTWRPTDGQLEGAKTQEEFYAETWKQNQQELFIQYLNEFDENATVNDREDAFNRSIVDATGRGPCEANRAGSCWFFFTVMTTIGYGNQAPVTSGGRYLTAAYGFVCIILFAAVLGTTGNIIAAVYSDTVRRFNLNFLSRPFLVTVFWCVIAFAWTVATAEYSFQWWADRLDPENQPDRYDAQWFAFISTTTVGLGDFFLPPEVLFIHDAFAFAFLFLAAFAFFAAFLSALVSYVTSFMPEQHDVFEVQLEETNLIPGEQTIKKWIVKGLNLIPCINLEEPVIDKREGMTVEELRGRRRKVDEAAYLEELAQLSTVSNKTFEQLQREEELLQELYEFKKRQRLYAQFGFRRLFNRQKATRHLELSLGDKLDDEEDEIST